MRYRQFADAPTRRTATRFTLVCVLPPSANSLAIQKKCGPNPNRIDLVEAAGVEPKLIPRCFSIICSLVNSYVQ